MGSANATDSEENGTNNDQCTQKEDSTSMKTKLFSRYTFVIGYGANDSCLPDGSCSRHHVPLDEYSSNLKQMIELIHTWNDADTSVALLTPPPCDTNIRGESRNNENVTALYSRECIKIGNEMNVPVVDLWNEMQRSTRPSDQDYGDKWKSDYLSDGLHLTSLGNYRLYQSVVEMLETSLGLTVEQLPRQYPDHSLVDANHPEETFGTEIEY